MKSAQTVTSTAKMQADPLTEEILSGLQGETKKIAPKYFYDQKGAALFDEITELDEYYVTRVEEQIFRDNRSAICAAIGNGVHVVEPGAGSCEKIRWLLPELQPDRYIPMDISAEHLHASAARLSDEFPHLEVVTQAYDHTEGLKLDAHAADAPRVFFYPGSSIGNFEPHAAVEFMRAMRAEIADEGGLLIGVDTKKSTDVLHAAYNDSAGVTGEFNLNVLDHLNNLLGGDLVADNFVHIARYDETYGRIEMHLECKRHHSAVLAGERLDFSAGERIHTENSYKYYPAEFIELAEQAGFAHRELWQDEQKWFSVMYFEPV
jgi:dimethylhistidine N-methyltransferase